MKKQTKVWITAAALSLAMASSAYAGWEQNENGYQYVFDNGGYARDQIIKIDGINYAFNKEGYMATEWYQNGGRWYYFSTESGAQVTGWLQWNEKWYYLNPESFGAMHTSWLNLGKKRYYLDGSGAMQTGAFVVDGYYYFAEPDGNIRRNKIETENGVTIWYDDEGREWYKNADSAVYGKAGGDVWLPVLNDNDLKEQFLEVEESNSEYIKEVKDELYDVFRDRVSATNKQKDFEKAIESWKKKAARRLGELNVSQEEIDGYIYEVVAALYNGEGGSWEYEITKNGARYIYVYYGDASDLEEEDWDYDY